MDTQLQINLLKTLLKVSGICIDASCLTMLIAASICSSILVVKADLMGLLWSQYLTWVMWIIAYTVSYLTKAIYLQAAMIWLDFG